MQGISFDQAADYYDTTRGYPFGVAEQIHAAILRVTGADAATRFLEIGVGTGRIALPFISAGAHYSGIDLSLAMMRRLIAKLDADATSSIVQVPVSQADLMHLPFSAQTINVVIAVHVLHLVPDWQEAIMEARRVLQPGGQLVIARDSGANRNSGAASPAQNIRQIWNDILNELRGTSGSVQRRWLTDDQLSDYTRGLGATVWTEMLVEYTSAPVSPRAMGERLAQRMYSSDWETPDAIHSEAVRRLHRWLDNECPAPDEPVTAQSRFDAVLARW